MKTIVGKNMKIMVGKLISVEREMAEEKGPFLLFALFLREDAPNVWDLVVSAPWISKDEAGSLRYIAGKIQSTLRPEEIVKLSHIEIIKPDNPGLKEIQEEIHVEHGAVEIGNSELFGMEMKRGFVITSGYNGSPAPDERIQPSQHQAKR